MIGLDEIKKQVEKILNYIKINKEINNLAPIEKMINEARTIQNLHNLIKNNGQDFNLTKEQIELAKKLQ